MADIDWSKFKPVDAPDQGASSVDWSGFKPVESKKKPEGGFGAALVEGAQSTGRSLKAAAQAVAGDAAGVEATARAQTSAQMNSDAAALTALKQDLAQRKAADDSGIWAGVKNVAGAAWQNPKGMAQLIAEQLPNSAVVLGGGAAGMSAGAAVAPFTGPLAPLAPIAGGLLGMLLGNTALETGGKALEKAEGGLTPDERDAALKEGAIKGAVVTGVDAATLGASKLLFSPVGKAMEAAGAGALAKAGVDVADKSAVEAALKSPEIVRQVQQAQSAAMKAANAGGKGVARVAGATGLETLGEGVGEGFGEYAATGTYSPTEAVSEAVSSLGQSGAEVAYAKTKEQGKALVGKTAAQLDQQAPLTDPRDQTNLTFGKAVDTYLRGPSDAETAGAVMSQGSVDDAIAAAEGAAGTMPSVAADKGIAIPGLAGAPVDDSQTGIGIPALADKQAAAVAAAQAQLGINPGQPTAPDARTAEQITADAAARRSDAGQRVISEMGESLPRFRYTPALQGNQEQEPAPIDRPMSYVEQLRATPTPQAKAFVHLFDTGRVTRQDVQDLIDRQDQQAAAAVAPPAAPALPSNAAAPAPAGGLIVAPGSKPRGDRTVDGRLLTDEQVQGLQQAEARVAERAGRPAPAATEDVNARLAAAAQAGDQQAMLRGAQIRDRGQVVASQIAEDLSRGDKQRFRIAYENVAQRGGVATPGEAAVLDRMSPNERLYDQVAGSPAALKTATAPGLLPTAEQQGKADARADLTARKLGLAPAAPEGTSAPLLVAPAPAPRATAAERLNAAAVASNQERGAERMAQQERMAKSAQAAADAKTAEQAIPAQRPSPAPDAVIGALKTIPALRTAEQKATIDAARATMTPEQMGILEKASRGPFALDATERTALQAMRAAPPAPANPAPPGGMKASEKRAPAERLAALGESKSTPEKQVTFTQVDPATLSEGRSAGAGELSRQTYGTIKQIARVFGKKVVLFDSSDERAADGFIYPDDQNTIYLNRKAEKPHLVVFGHELMHGLKRNNQAAYDAVAKVVKLKQGVDLDQVPGIKGDTEELVSDLQGNRFAETEFWADVFRELAGDSPAGKQAVMKLAAAAMRAVNKVMKALGRPQGYDSDQLVENLDEVKGAIKKALATYAKDRYADAVAMDRAERAQAPVAQRVSEKPDLADKDAGRGAGAGNSETGNSLSAVSARDSFLAVNPSPAADKDKKSAVGDRRLPERVGPPTKAQMAARRAREDMGVLASAKRAAWAPSRVDDLLDNYAYTQSGTRTKALAGWVSPEAFLAATTPADEVARLEAERKPLDPAELSNQRQAITLFGDLKDRTFKTNGHEGRHRMMALRDAGVENVPVVFKLSGGEEFDSIQTGVFVTKQRWGHAEGQKGFLVGLTPIAYDFKQELLRKFGNGDVKFSEKRENANDETTRTSQEGTDAAGDGGRRQDRPGSAPLPGAPVVAGASGPDPRLVQVAEDYARSIGIELRRQSEYVDVDEDRARRIADAYAAMPHDPRDPKVREAYENLIRQTTAQYQALADAGYKFWFIDPTNDPYKSPFDAMRELRAKQTMGVFPTNAGFGSGATDLDVSQNPMLEDTGYRWPYGSLDGELRPVLANDLFRAVHDAFGHGLEGAGFRARGEENAWQAHIRLFTGSAQGAITTETRGQNSWLNYGPYGEKNQTAKVEDTVFADQKTGLMPEWTWTEGRAGDEVVGSAKRKGPIGATGPVPDRIDKAADISAARKLAGTKRWATNRDFKLALQAAVRGVEKTFNLRRDTPEVRKYLVRQVLKEAREALITNANAIGWYDEKVTTALEVVSTIHPELKTDDQAKFAFIWALATTSNGVKVDKNFELAERTYRIWKASHKDPAKRRMPTSGIGVGTAAGQIHKGLATYNRLMSAWGYTKLQKFATTLQPNRQIAADFGRPVNGEGLDTMVYGAGVIGPKIGNGFFMNLYGKFEQLTMDRWWVRMWGRMIGNLVEVDKANIQSSREAFLKIIDEVRQDRDATRAIERAIKTRLSKSDHVGTAKAIIAATSNEDVRVLLKSILPATPEREATMLAARGKLTDFISVADELRKAAKSYYKYLDGQIEAPQGSKQRDMMRAVARDVLAELQKEHPHLTMADFQALMWYPEKTLYDSAGATEESEDGYEDNEAPDYANAAIALARDQGISDADIDSAVERARVQIQARQRAGRGGRGAGRLPDQAGNGAGGTAPGQEGLSDQPVESAKRVTETPAFRRWFGDSKIVDPYGKPLIVYHGTGASFDTFKKGRSNYTAASSTLGYFFTNSPEVADLYADENAENDQGQNVVPVFLSIKNPKFESEDKIAEIESDWSVGRGKAWLAQLKKQGYDGIVFEGGDEIVAFYPEQIKSAIGNNGDFSPAEASIIRSDKRVFHDSGRAYTPEQLKALERVGGVVEERSLAERLQSLKQDWQRKLRQGLVDQFAPIQDLGAPGKAAYALARLSKGSSGAVEALLHHGKLSLTKDGVYDADQSGGAMQRVFAPLGRETGDFLRWIAAQRAERLAAEDRENLFTPADIAALKGLDRGTLSFDYTLQHGPRAGQVTRDRTLVYRDAQKTFNEFQSNVLQMAEQSGLIDGDLRRLFENAPYVPFYREADDGGGFVGASLKDGLVKQKAFERLRGGTNRLHSDLLANVLMNWSHLIDASAKNRAAVATLDAAAGMGAAHRVPAASKGTVWAMRNGKVEHYAVDDALTLKALTSLTYNGLSGWGWDMLTAPKRWLTIAVTSSPAFKIRNLVRDSMQAVAVSDLSPNVLANVKQGWKASDKDSQTYVSALAGGGLIRFGTMLEGRQADHVRQMIKQANREGSYLDSESALRRFYDTKLEPAIAAYNELGNRSEEINRAALYEQLKQKGFSDAEANLAARDLMDFSMMGAWGAVRFLTAVVPFLNARIQGLYKLGRGAAEDPRRFAAVLGAVALAGITLMAAYSDDDDFRKREDWDRNTNWWFKFGGVTYRIPRPFEIGAIAVLAERGIEFAFNPDMTGKRYAKNVRDILLDNLSMNPVPQAVKPIIDLYANKDSFTGRPIEGPAMQRLRPELRYSASTSMTARGLSAATGSTLSPVQVDHLLQGYFSWLGSFVLFMPELIMREATGQPERPARDWFKFATQGIVQERESGGSYYVTALYEQAAQIEKDYASYRQLVKEGKLPEAAEFFQDHKDTISKYKSVEKVKTGEGKLAEMIRMVERSTAMDADEKKARIIRLREQQDRLARTLTSVAR